MNLILWGVTLLSLITWIFLLGFWGQFWRTDQRIKGQTTNLESFPSVCAIIPARNEAELLPISLRSLLTQDYPGEFSLVLVDDQSTDDTASIAYKIAQETGRSQQLEVISGQPLPSGWTGKLWAIEQGILHTQKLKSLPDYILLTDADIEHDSANLSQLVSKAQQKDLDLVSLMVLLRCQSFWEKLLIPAFVFFFQKLYPFRWVNNPQKNTAAAAGGCILITGEALRRIGGIQVLREALIDDCTLAQAVKSSSKSQTNNNPNSTSIWLGLTDATHSLRTYSALNSIWDMVARSAFTQLNYSPLLLGGTLIGMTVVYLVAPISLVWSLFTGNWLIAIAAFSTWLLMAIAYLPTIRLYQRSPILTFCLPAIAFLYTLMTLDSAFRHWRGRGGAWKGRVYSN